MSEWCWWRATALAAGVHAGALERWCGPGAKRAPVAGGSSPQSGRMVLLVPGSATPLAVGRAEGHARCRRGFRSRQESSLRLSSIRIELPGRKVERGVTAVLGRRTPTYMASL
ncbi:hypothetical protein C8J57DRAFT_1224129 [Mycena rebaudengoi]|nr:hypothetical protein C8J57DRAFT_1224129 [Mycena rebaudengoi]